VQFLSSVISLFKGARGHVGIGIGIGVGVSGARRDGETTASWISGYDHTPNSRAHTDARV
jgi:hypothetical protein